MLRPVKSVKQRYSPPNEILTLLEAFRSMVNDVVRKGLEHEKEGLNCLSLKQLSNLCYRELAKKYNDCPSYYKLCAISRARGILASRRKSIRRGIRTKSPYAVKPQLASCYAFKTEKGSLWIPIAKRRYFEIPLNTHTLSVISFHDPTLKVRSFTLTPNALSLTISKDVSKVECTNTAAVDRNLRNLTYGNDGRVIQYDLSKVTNICQATKEIVSSFRRNDVRIRKEIASKYGRRRKERTNNLIHCTTKHIVEEAFDSKEAIVLEDIAGIGKLYRKGNWQGRKYRGMMNSWSFFEAQRQIEYKAKWKGIPVIHLSKGETRGTTLDCPRCGERLQLNRERRRELWCPKCKRWMDRDIVAVMNQSRRGWVRFAQSLPDRNVQAKGEAGEAMVQERGTEGGREPLILKVDASKLASRHHR